MIMTECQKDTSSSDGLAQLEQLEQLSQDAKSAMSRLLKSYPYTWADFDAVEIHPGCFENGDPIGCDDENDAEFYDVLIHVRSGGTVDLLECRHRDTAEVIGDIVESWIADPMLRPTESTSTQQ
jgi:hypothetical protein